MVISINNPQIISAGVGCPICSKGKQGGYSEQYFNNFPEQQDVPGIVYLVTIGDNWCKVGVTKNKNTNTKERVKNI